MGGVWRKNSENNLILSANLNEIEIDMTRMTINN